MKGVTAIPMVEERARTILAALTSRNNVDRRASLLPTEAAREAHAIEETAAEIDDVAPDGAKSPRVKFADEDQVKVVSPLPDRTFDDVEDSGPPSPSSTISTPSSDLSTNTDTVVKTLADRLSFWTRLSKRNSRQAPTIDHTLVEQSDQTLGEPLDLEAIAKDDSKEREEVLEAIVSSAAPAPQTMEEKHSELEDKIVRECIREFTRGGMYFAYTFGQSFALPAVYNTYIAT